MAPKGEFEIQYFGGPDNPAPNGGVNFSLPTTSLPPNDLAPGTTNTQSINGFLCSSPWVANAPFTFSPASTEWVMGIFSTTGGTDSGYGGAVIIVTNIGVYTATNMGNLIQPQIPLNAPILRHTWAAGEINQAFVYPGRTVSFIQVNGIVYFTGRMLKGVFFYTSGSVSQATNYVAGDFIGELAGRLVIAECVFPTGGGTGTSPLPTIAWSGVGIFGQAWDGNPAHDVWNPANQAFFSGNIGGFNLLGDVPDQINGMATIGQSIILVRENGITQQDPNSTYSNSGIQPYNWYHMWASSQGVGGISGTVAQFGQILAFRSSDNVYSLSMSGGLSPLGNKIIAKMISDLTTIKNSPGVVTSFTSGGGLAYPFQHSFWHLSSIYVVDGQLHYVVTLTAYTTNPSVSQQITSAFAYDLNMAEGSWHTWDFSQYFLSTGSGSGFLGFSCPVTQSTISYVGNFGTPFNVGTSTQPSFLLFGAFTTYGPLVNSPGVGGTIFQLVPFDYDQFTANQTGTGYTGLLYSPRAYPNTLMVFRTTTLSLGHKLSTRRVRILAANAGISTGIQQLAQATIAGESSAQVSTSTPLRGDVTDTTGSEIRTYYFDGVLSDYSIYVVIKSLVNPTSPWLNLCGFRLASASLIGIDATGTTQ